jgi:hypothetical protein
VEHIASEKRYPKEKKSATTHFTAVIFANEQSLKGLPSLVRVAYVFK